jgi:serine/threonine-protein kinase HipA
MFGRLIQVSESHIDKTLDQFLSPQSLVYALTEQSFLDAKLKRMYIRSYEERLERLRRVNAQESLG